MSVNLVSENKTVLDKISRLIAEKEYFEKLAQERLEYIAKNEEELSSLRGEVERYREAIQKISYELPLLWEYYPNAARKIEKQIEQLKDSGDE